MRLPRLCSHPAWLFVAAAARAASFDERVEVLFRPPLGELIALSPDGRRLAYTQPGRDLRLVIVSVEGVAAKRTLRVDGEKEEAAPGGNAAESLRFLRWATPSRLVFAPVERIAPLPPVRDQAGRLQPNPDGPTIVSPIFVIDADTKQRGTLVDARNFMETPAEARRSLADFLRTPNELAASRNESVRWRMPHLDILGFLPRDGVQLVLQTRGAYSVPAQHLIDIQSGSVREFGGDWPTPPAEPLVFDWARLKVVGERHNAARPLTAWRDDELRTVQRELETKFPRRAVELIDWTETRTRVLFRVTGGTDAGRVFVYQRPENLAVEVLRRAPWLTAAKLHETRFFEFRGTDGAPLSGYLTWPTRPPVVPPPLVVVFPSGFPGGAQPAFDPEAQVFADFGCAVARLNHRGVAGLRPEDLTALHGAIDRVTIEDARAVIAWLAAHHPGRPFDPRRVVALGRGFGGYAAIRALQLAPQSFCCGIAVDAPLDLAGWLRATARRDVPLELLADESSGGKTPSAGESAEPLAHPALFLVESERRTGVETSVRDFCARARELGRTAEYAELGAGFAAAHPTARAAAYRRVETFLHQHLHGFGAKIGAAKEIE